ncbi:hypothetical protein VTI74DRAFT_2139 [Chaetomium olivicolor]
MLRVTAIKARIGLRSSSSSSTATVRRGGPVRNPFSRKLPVLLKTKYIGNGLMPVKMEETRCCSGRHWQLHLGDLSARAEPRQAHMKPEGILRVHSHDLLLLDCLVFPRL